MAVTPHADSEAPRMLSVAKAGAVVAAAPLAAIAIAAAFLNSGGLAALTLETLRSGGALLAVAAFGVAGVGAVLAMIVGAATGGRHPVQVVGTAGGIGVWMGPLVGALFSPRSWTFQSADTDIVVAITGGIAVWTLGAILWLRLAKPRPELYTKQAQRRGWRPALAAVSIIFGFVQCGLASRQVVLPSESVAESKRRGVFLRQLDVPTQPVPTDEGTAAIEELWIESTRDSRWGISSRDGWARMVVRFAPLSPPSMLFLGREGDAVSILTRSYEGPARSRVVSGRLHEQDVPDSIVFLSRLEADRRIKAQYPYRPAQVQPAPDSAQ